MVDAGQVEFFRTEELTQEATAVLFEWAPDPFCAREWGLSWRPTTDHLVIRCGGRLASHVGFLRDTVHVDGRGIPVGGIGGVITVPEFQRRGLAQKGIHKALGIIWNEWHLEYAVLFCYPPLRSFYERMGWTAIDAPVWVAQPRGRIRFPAIPMFLSRRGEPWPSGDVEVAGLPW